MRPPDSLPDRNPTARQSASPFQGRVLADGFEESALIVEAVGLARENRAEIEAESVDMRKLHPVTQAVRNHLDDSRMADVHRVARTRVVDVIPPVSGIRR